MAAEVAVERGLSRVNRPELQLVVTAACTLCDEALDWLASMPDAAGRTLVTTEVTEDDATFDRYAHRVPVLIIGNTEHDWPFDAKAVSRALAGDDVP